MSTQKQNKSSLLGEYNVLRASHMEPYGELNPDLLLTKLGANQDFNPRSA